jgi:hypothetical protein
MDALKQKAMAGMMSGNWMAAAPYLVALRKQNAATPSPTPAPTGGLPDPGY